MATSRLCWYLFEEKKQQMNSEIHIRDARTEDKAAIIKILERTPEFPPSDVAVAKEVLDACFNHPGGSEYHTLLAENGNSILGYVTYGPAPLTEGSWDIYWIAVAPEAKRRGIGKALLETVEHRVKTARGRLLFIETSSMPAYENTRRFYHGRGYEIVGRIPDFYAIGDAKIIFQKRFSR
jgi:ribosomal protein S18 acetylase RimI-like enzyme